MKLRLESPRDSLDLDSVARTGTGVQALTGLVGMGLPDLATQWIEGAGDGALYRGRRVLPRDIDITLLFQGRDREHLKHLLNRFALMCAGPMTLRMIEPNGESWSTTVHRIGGGSYVYGEDTIGDRDLQMVVTFRAGDPFMESSKVNRSRVDNRGTGRSMLGSGLAKMKVSPSEAIGRITLDNTGTAHAYPVWTVVGPGTEFHAHSPTGEDLIWNGTLAAGESIKLDTKTATVVDQDGNNRYSELAVAPRFWSVPPGRSVAVASLSDVTDASYIECLWRPRNWLVV